MYQVEYSNKFHKSYKRAKKRGLPLEQLLLVIEKLSKGLSLEAKYRDHALTGNYIGYRECHIQPDWLLVYKIEKKRCVLYLLNTGTHSDLFD